MAWRTDAARLVLLVADAPPHLDCGGPQYDTDMQAALAKSIKLFAVGASGPGTQTVHDVKNYSVQTLGRLVVRLVGEETARLGRS